MARHRFLLAALAVASLYTPCALHAQSTTPAARPAPSAAAAKAVAPELQAFAKLQFALNLARDEYNAALSKAHEPAAKTEAMDAFEKKRAEILTSMGTSEPAYSRELYVVSSDPTQRAAFDRLMKELAQQ